MLKQVMNIVSTELHMVSNKLDTLSLKSIRLNHLRPYNALLKYGALNAPFMR
jgi:hypothetical protein